MFFVANWKMRGDMEQIQECITNFTTNQKPYLRQSHTIIICPPYPYIQPLVAAGLTVGAQDCSANPNGSYTGEVSANMLADIGCKYLIIGHSERRKNFNEQLDLISAKMEKAFEAGLKPIICAGELTQGLTPEAALDFITNELEQLQISRLKSTGLLAYEPVWAIGTGLIPTNKHISHIATGLHQYTKGSWPVLYGGSIDVHNISDLKYVAGISGFLIGGASLPAANLLELIRLCSV
ncbi:MAG: triose-phosphate isomerase [Proteobacteria bacterium]|nr:triose-phosphate isomerase [Pseudomonadota bacterium]